MAAYSYTKYGNQFLFLNGIELNTYSMSQFSNDNYLNQKLDIN